MSDTYFVGNRTVASDELGKTIGNCPNIFSCMLAWGSLWQETPEECIALYRELMASPVFGSTHHILWGRSVEAPMVVNPFGDSFEPPRLVAWNERDRAGLPLVWDGFIRS